MNTILKQRIITASIASIFVIATLFLLEPFWFSAIFSLLIIVGIWEWIELFKIGNKLKYSLYILNIFNLIFVLYGLVNAPSSDSGSVGYFYWVVAVFILLNLLFIVPFQIILYQKKKYTYKLSFPNLFFGILLLWTTWAVIADVYVFDSTHSHYKDLPYEFVLLYLFLVVWSADIAAYFVGKRFGRHKLASEISPGKTWEGAAGGVVGGVIVAVLATYFYKKTSCFCEFDIPSFLNFIGVMFFASIIVIFSIVGDLYVSMAKRQAGKKDSGVLFPGHGGVLDRIDSFIYPVIFMHAILVLSANFMIV